MPPGVKFATLMASARCSAARSRDVDDSAAKAVPGVRQVVVLDDLVAVVGDHMWAAKQGLEALDITWDEGPNADVDYSQTSGRRLRAGEREGRASSPRPSAMRRKALTARRRDRGDLRDAVPRPRADGADELHRACARRTAARSGSARRCIARAQAAAAKVTGLPLEKVIVHNHLLGGGFGRRLEVDMVDKAVRIAQKVEARSRSCGRARRTSSTTSIGRSITTALGAARRRQDRRLEASHHRLVGHRALAAAGVHQNGIDLDAVDCAVDMPYDIPNMRVEYRARRAARRCRPASGAASARTTMCSPSRASSTNWPGRPARIRSRSARTCSAKTPRLLGGARPRRREIRLGHAAAATRRPRRRQRRSPSAASSRRSSRSRSTKTARSTLRRIVAAVDTGIAVNPDTIVAQLQGGLIFGLTAALYGEITIEKGRVQQSNFNDYRMLRIDQVPPIEVHLIAERRSARRHRRDRHDRRSARLAQRDLRRDRRAAAPPADRSRRARGEEAGMNEPSFPLKRLGTLLCHRRGDRRAAVARRSRLDRLGPGRSAFAGAATVALADYKRADPTGVPAEFKRDRPRSRAANIWPKRPTARPATPRKGGTPFAGGLRVRDCRSARSTRPTSHPTRKPASADGATRISCGAVHKGIGRDGAHLYPAMPYAAYTT